MDRITKYASFSLVFAPILSPYFLPGTNTALETFFIFINSSFFFVFNIFHRKSLAIPSMLKLFFIYALVAPLLGFLYYGNSSTFISSYISIFIVLISCTQYLPYLNFVYIKKYYGIIVFLACVFFCVQEIMFQIGGWRISGLCSLLPVCYEYTTMDQFIQNQMIAPRSQSFFLEPAHFVQYIVGYLAILLGENLNNRKIFNVKTVLLTFVVFFTWSGNAIALLLVLWIAYFSFLKVKTNYKITIFIPLLLVILFVAYPAISKSEKGEKLLNRTEELNSSQDRVSSGMIRIFRGYFVYSSMPLLLTITGVGSATSVDAIEGSRYFWMFYQEERYLNTAQTLLIGYGLIGFLFYMLFLRQLFCSTNYIVKLFVLVFIVLSLIESFWGNSKMFILLLIPCTLYNNLNYLRYENHNTRLRYPS